MTTRDEVKAELDAACRAIATAAILLRPHADLFERFRRESELMSSVGSILNPTLFMSSERRAVEAMLSPIFSTAEKFVREYDEAFSRAAGALDKVSGGK